MRRRPLLTPLALACLFTATIPLTGHAADTAGNTDARDVLTRADALLKQHQANQAYELLAPLEDERAGDPDFDYLLGEAALESGQAGRAAFAFERCLAADPRNGPCRVQMARTHLALGESVSARQEFQTIADSQPPAEVATLVNQYLGSIAQNEASQRRRISAFVQAGGGYDSNVTSTTDARQIALPLFGGAQFTLNGLSSQTSDNFLQAEAGATLEYPLTPAWTLTADADVRGRSYQEVDRFNNIIADANFGAAYRAGPHTTSLRLQLQDYQLDQDDYRSLYGVLAQYQYELDALSAVSAYAQVSQLDYHLQGAPDALRYTLGTGYSQALSQAAVFYGGLYGGQEKSDISDIGLGQDFYGLRLGGNLDVSRTLRLTSALSVEKRRFDGMSVLFLATRNDTEVDLSLGAIYRPVPQFSIRPNYTFSNSDSNIVLDDYKRHVVSLDLRYEM